jgi:gluconokinase
MILSIDMGTSSVRALLFDGQGREVEAAGGRREVSYHQTADGTAEADPEELFGLLGECVDDALAGAGERRGPIEAVAFSSFLHGMLGVSAEGRPLTPAYSWADTRSAPEAEELSGVLDSEEVRQRTGCPLHPSYYAPKLRWLARTDPETFRQVDWWCSPAEYCLYRLFAVRRCTLSLASGTGLLDVRTCRWDLALLDATETRQERLSELAGSPLTGLSAPHRSRWPSLARVPWFPAASDAACSSIGSGCGAADTVAVMIGTSGAMRVVLPSCPSLVPPGLWCYRLDYRRVLLGGVLGNAGNLRRWMSDTLALGRSAEQADAEILGRGPHAHGLTVLPFFTGERSTGWDPHARAAITGMSLSTTPLDILQAGMEAVAYRLAAIFDLLLRAAPEPSRIVASGGALVRSRAWTQVVADVLERPVTRSLASEASCRGAALLALEALGRSAEASPLYGETVEPRREHAAAHQAARARQEKLRDLLAGL